MKSTNFQAPISREIPMINHPIHIAVCAGFPACGFRGNSCPHFQELRPHPLLITPGNPPAVCH